MNYRIPTHKQQGAALVVAILIVALVAVLTIGSSGGHLVTIKRASNQILTEQAYGYLTAMETIAAFGLAQSFNQQQNQGSQLQDDCQQVWLQETPPFVIEEGFYAGQLEDLHGRFNLNNLASSGSGNAGGAASNNAIPNNVHQARFMRLIMSFDALQLTTDDARQITEAVIDWVDGDGNPTGFGGAEDSFYEGGEQRIPHRAANRPFVNVSELIQVAHMTPQLYHLLRQHVTVWPQNGGDINIFTATPNVLRSLNVPTGGNNPSSLEGTPVAAPAGEQLAATMRAVGYTTVDDFKTDAAFTGTNIDTTGLATVSEFFLLEATVQLGDYRTSSTSVLQRANGNALVLSRDQHGGPVTNWCIPPSTTAAGGTGTTITGSQNLSGGT